MGDTAVRTAGYHLLVDWDNNGAMSTSEDISSDVELVRWGRGREDERANTPAGFLEVSIADPNADYSPQSTATRFGAGNVVCGRRINLLVVDSNNTTYDLFTGVIDSIKPEYTPTRRGAFLTSYDGMERLGLTEIYTFQTPSDSDATGGSSAGSTITGNLSGPTTIGNTTAGATGAIGYVLNQAEWPSTARALSEPGASTIPATAGFYDYGKTARDLLQSLETHEFRSIIYVNASGSMEFQSSTHRNASTSVATFNDTSFLRLDYRLSNANAINSITANQPQVSHESTLSVVGYLPEPIGPRIAISSGSTYYLTIPYTVDCRLPIVPQETADFKITNSTSDELGFGNVTNFTVYGRDLAGKAMALRIVNNSSLGLVYIINSYFGQAGWIGTTSMNITIRGSKVIRTNVANTYTDTAASGARGLRRESRTYSYFTGDPVGSTLATAIVNHLSTGRPDGIKLHLAGSDTNLRVQIWSRRIGDRITVNSTRAGVVNRDYYIEGSEWEVVPGNAGQGFIKGHFSLSQAT